MTDTTNKNADTKTKPKLGPVVKGATEIKKKTGLQKVVKDFLPGDLGQMKKDIYNKVIIPTVKKSILDGVSMLLYGTTSSPSNLGKVSKVIYQAGSSIYHDAQKQPKNQTPSSNSDCATILFESKDDADLVVTTMQASMDQYQSVSISDYYDVAGHPELSEFTDTRFGWRNLAATKIIPVDGGKWKIIFPPAIPLY